MSALLKIKHAPTPDCARAVAKLRELADRLESGAVEGAGAHWMPGLDLHWTQVRRDVDASGLPVRKIEKFTEDKVE